MFAQHIFGKVSQGLYRANYRARQPNNSLQQIRATVDDAVGIFIKPYQSQHYSAETYSKFLIELYASLIQSLDSCELQEKIHQDSPSQLCKWLVTHVEEKHGGVVSQEMKRVVHLVAETLISWLKAGKIPDRYPLVTPPKKVLIFYTTKNRKGCEQERQSIQESLASWVLVKSEVLRDAGKPEFERAIDQAHDENISALIVIIMSHGRAGYFNVADGEINIQNFLDHNLYSEKTKNIPKVAVIQACQELKTTNRDYSYDSAFCLGNIQKKGITQGWDARPTSGSKMVNTFNKRDQSTFVLTQRHMAVIMSTAYGTVSRRQLMIPRLAAHLSSWSGGKGDVYEAFLKTAKEMEDCLPEQVPVYNSTLTSKLCLGRI